MTEHKFTDEEVINSLKICANNGDCKECAINPHKGNYGFCTGLAINAALDLINRQREEIAVIKETTAEIRYEAVKEFADRLKNYYRNLDTTAGGLVEYHIDQVVKEFLDGGGKRGATDSQDNY